MEQPETIGQRIKQVRGELSQKAFGAKIGLSQTAVTALENDQSEPRLSTFNKIVEVFSINPEWLRCGTGYKRLVRDPAIPELEQNQPGYVAPQEEEEQPALVTEPNQDSYYHRYHALLDLVKSGFFGSPEQLLRKKALASSGAASLYETVDAIAAEYPLYVEPGFKQAGRQLRLA